MSKIKCILFLFFVLCLKQNLAQAQNWTGLGSGVNFQSRVLYVDSVFGKLFVGGNFWTAGGYNTGGIASWDGNDWDSLAGGMHSGINPVLAITRFQNQLLVGGFFRRSGNYVTNGFTSWNGISWDSINSAFHPSGGPANFYEHNNVLYCVGSFDSVGTYYSPQVVGWDGVNWIPVLIPGLTVGGYTIADCIAFNGELYFGGHFTDSTFMLYDFVKWDGSNWYKAGNNFSGYIYTMAVYNNELYIGGNLLAGGPDPYIVKFDGTNFYPVGGGINGPVNRLRVINNKLVAVGTFDHAGGNYASDIAIYDGQSWSALSPDTFDITLVDVAIYNNELYVTGSFHKINNDSIQNIAKYTSQLPFSIHENGANVFVSIFPSPAKDIVTINFNMQNKNSVLEIFNVLGEKVSEQKLPRNTKEFSLPVAGWSQGIYLCRLLTEKGDAVCKFVKQ